MLPVGLTASPDNSKRHAGTNPSIAMCLTGWRVQCLHMFVEAWLQLQAESLRNSPRRECKIDGSQMLQLHVSWQDPSAQRRVDGCGKIAVSGALKLRICILRWMGEGEDQPPAEL